jgi:hypothetical protein
MDQIRSDQISDLHARHAAQCIYSGYRSSLLTRRVLWIPNGGARVVIGHEICHNQGQPRTYVQDVRLLAIFFLYQLPNPMCAGNAILMINSCTVYIYMCTSICMNARMHFSLLQVTNSLVLALYALGCAVKQYKIMITAENSRFHVLCILVQLPFMYMDSNYQIKFNWVTNHTH